MKTTTTTEPAVLQLDALEVGYLGQPILPPVNLTVHRGEIWALAGRNGAGKSTLLRTLLGLQPAIGGVIRHPDGVEVGFVPQRDDHDPEVPARVIDFIRAGVDRGWSFLSPFHVDRHRDLIQRAMRQTDVVTLADRSYRSLSVGQRQRVNIARAFVGEPDLLVLDEPTSAMDPENERSVFELLRGLTETHGTAVFIASHTMAFIPRHATHVALVDSDDDLVLAGPRDEVMRSDVFHDRYGFVLEAPHG